MRDIGTSEGDAALARAVIAMAHGLGVEVVAEGIESLEQLAMLRRYGCDEGQGYFLGRPVVPSEVPALLRRQDWTQLRRHRRLGLNARPAASPAARREVAGGSRFVREYRRYRTPACGGRA